MDGLGYQQLPLMERIAWVQARWYDTGPAHCGAQATGAGVGLINSSEAMGEQSFNNEKKIVNHI